MFKAYLGDGLYAEFDGYMLTLKADDVYTPTDTVYFDPHVFSALLRYMKLWENDPEPNPAGGETQE